MRQRRFHRKSVDKAYSDGFRHAAQFIDAQATQLLHSVLFVARIHPDMVDVALKKYRSHMDGLIIPSKKPRKKQHPFYGW